MPMLDVLPVADDGEDAPTTRGSGRSPSTSPSRPLGTDSAWLAAYALGLAYSSGSDDESLAGLLAATSSQPELLDAAHARLHGAEVADPPVCEKALCLLERARALAASAAPATCSER